MKVLDRIQQANPIPNEERLLSGVGAMDQFVESVKVKSGLVEPTPSVNTTRRGFPRDNRLYGLLAAVSVAAATLLLIGGSLILWNGPPIVGPVGSTASPLDRVHDAYTDLNAGDINRWLAHFTEDALVFGFPKNEAADLYAVLSVAGHQTLFVEPCREVEPTSVGEVRIVCKVTESNDFHGAAGITLTREETFVLATDGLIRDASARVVKMTQPGYYVFNQAFFDWLRETHPEVHSEIRPKIATHLPSDPEQMATAMDHLGEFLAQSDRFNAK